MQLLYAHMLLLWLCVLSFDALPFLDICRTSTLFQSQTDASSGTGSSASDSGSSASETDSSASDTGSSAPDIGSSASDIVCCKFIK